MADLKNYMYIFQYDGSLPVRMSISCSMVPGTILALGSDQHRHLIAEFGSGNVCRNITISWIIIIKLINWFFITYSMSAVLHWLKFLMEPMQKACGLEQHMMSQRKVLSFIHPILKLQNVGQVI